MRCMKCGCYTPDELDVCLSCGEPLFKAKVETDPVQTNSPHNTPNWMPRETDDLDGDDFFNNDSLNNGFHNLHHREDPNSYSHNTPNWMPGETNGFDRNDFHENDSLNNGHNDEHHTEGSKGVSHNTPNWMPQETSAFGGNDDYENGSLNNGYHDTYYRGREMTAGSRNMQQAGADIPQTYKIRSRRSPIAGTVAAIIVIVVMILGVHSILHANDGVYESTEYTDAIQQAGKDYEISGLVADSYVDMTITVKRNQCILRMDGQILNERIYYNDDNAFCSIKGNELVSSVSGKIITIGKFDKNSKVITLDFSKMSLYLRSEMDQDSWNSGMEFINKYGLNQMHFNKVR